MSIVKLISGMRKNTKMRYMIEKEIEKVKDTQEKDFFIKMYNDKLKALEINEKYERIPFEN